MRVGACLPTYLSGKMHGDVIGSNQSTSSKTSVVLYRRIVFRQDLLESVSKLSPGRSASSHQGV